MPDPALPAPPEVWTPRQAREPGSAAAARSRQAKATARLEVWARGLNAGLSDRDALIAALSDPVVGSQRFREQPDTRPVTLRRAKAYLLRTASPDFVARIRAEAETRIAAQVPAALDTMGSLLQESQEPDMARAAENRVRLEAAKAIVGAVGVNTSGRPVGGGGVVVNVSAATATAQHAATARAGERVARKLRELTLAVELLLAEAPPELAARVVTRLRAETGLEVRPARAAELVTA